MYIFFISIVIFIICFVVFYILLTNRNEESFSNYTPSYMCKNVGWENKNEINPYKIETSETWYNAVEKCKLDNQCKGFCFYGNSSNTSGLVKYYKTLDPSKVAPQNWQNSNYPNLYIKSNEPCIKTTNIRQINDLSSANLKNGKSPLEESYNFENKFFSTTKDLLNNYNHHRLENKTKIT